MWNPDGARSSYIFKALSFFIYLFFVYFPGADKPLFAGIHTSLRDGPYANAVKLCIKMDWWDLWTPATLDKQAWFKDATVVSSPTPWEKKTEKQKTKHGCSYFKCKTRLIPLTPACVGLSSSGSCSSCFLSCSVYGGVTKEPCLGNVLA